MNTELQFIFKILLYILLLITIEIIIVKNRKDKNIIMPIERGERLIEYKVIYTILLISSFVFGTILVPISNISVAITGLKGITRIIVLVFFLNLTIIYLILGFLYGRMYIKIGKEKIYWRDINGIKHEIKYEDISSYKIENENIVQLYKEDECILEFSMNKNKVFVTAVLRNRKVPRKEYNGGKLIIKERKFNTIFATVFFIGSVMMLALNLFYGLIIGILLFFICFVIFFKACIMSLTNKIIIENETIVEKNLLQKDKKINFNDVDYVSFKNEKNIEKILIYSKDGTIIKIIKNYQNTDILENIIKKEKWNRKK